MADRPSRVGADPAAPVHPTSAHPTSAQLTSAQPASPTQPGHPEPAASGGAARIMVNGAPRRVTPGIALPALLTELGLRPGSVVVEHNGVALPPSTMPDVRLSDGDVLEIVRAVAGG